VLAKLRERNPEAAAAVGSLDEKHEELGGLTQRFVEGIRAVLAEEEVPRDEVMKLAREFSEFLFRHIQEEERKFFPAAMNNLTTDDWNEVDRAIHTPPDPLFGAEVEAPFLELRAEIDRLKQESA